MFTLGDLSFPVSQGTLIDVYDSSGERVYIGTTLALINEDCHDKAVTSLEQTEDTIKIHIER